MSTQHLAFVRFPLLVPDVTSTKRLNNARQQFLSDRHAAAQIAARSIPHFVAAVTSIGDDVPCLDLRPVPPWDRDDATLWFVCYANIELGRHEVRRSSPRGNLPLSGHLPAELRDPFLDAVCERDFDRAARMASNLWNCSDILPSFVCDELDMPPGTTYARAVRQLRQERAAQL